MQSRIKEMERELSVSEIPEAARQLRRRIDTDQRLIIAWQDNYSSLLGFRSVRESPNALEVVETAQASEAPARPVVPFNTLLGGVLGLMLGLALAYLLEFRETTKPNSEGARYRVSDRGDRQHEWSGGSIASRPVAESAVSIPDGGPTRG